MPAGVADSLAAESLGWLEEAVDLAGRDERSGVADRYFCTPSGMAVEISTRPPSTLCRMVLPARFMITLSARAGSPVAGGTCDVTTRLGLI